MAPAEAVEADIREPKRVPVPSEAPPSEPGLTRQLLKDGGDEKVVPPPGRKDDSEKLRKSEEEGADSVLLALVNSRPGRRKRVGQGQKKERSEQKDGEAKEDNIENERVEERLHRIKTDII